MNDYKGMTTEVRTIREITNRKLADLIAILQDFDDTHMDAWSGESEYVDALFLHGWRPMTVEELAAERERLERSAERKRGRR